METRGIKLFRFFGFDVRLDGSWIFLALLVVWTLALGFFPARVPDYPPHMYWLMGVIGAIGLFLSIILHEFCHSLAARKYGLPMKGITLFIFGGIAEMSEEPQQPKSEFIMAIVGPLCSFVLAGFFYALYAGGSALVLSPAALAVLYYLGLINFMLAAFNLLPAFPLDGGRILRAAIWARRHNLRQATALASKIGRGFGLLLIALGVFSLFNGSLVSAIWWALIGMFLRSAASMSYQQMLTRELLTGEPVSRFMKQGLLTVPARITVEDFVQDYLYKYHHKLFPVFDNGQWVGCISTRKLKELARDSWSQLSVGQVAEPCSTDNTISSRADVLAALNLMNRTHLTRLLVTEGTQLIGIITLKDILQFLSLKFELEGEPHFAMQAP